MLDLFSANDKLAFIGALIHVTKADGFVFEEELQHLWDTMTRPGFEDFKALFTRYTEEIRTQESYLELMDQVTNPDIQTTIVRSCLQLAKCDNDVHPKEIEAIQEMCRHWHLDLAPIMAELDMA